MGTMHTKTAESLIFDLKQLLDAVWKKYGENAVRHSLIYAAGEYGVMQREELREIMEELADLKRHVDALSRDCQEIPQTPGFPINAPKRYP